MPNSIKLIDTDWESDFTYHTQWFKSPGYISCEVPLAVREELLESMKDTQGDARSTLRGHLDQEYHLKLTPQIKKFTRVLSFEFMKRFGFQPSMGMAESMRNIENSEVELKRLWVNYQKKYDFNPLHIHSGLFSFVIWVAIPYDLEEERKRYTSTNGNETAAFMFQYNTALGGLDTEYLYIDKSFEWKMAFFPSRLNHGVNPFYTSDEHRVSISGNVYLIDI
tara:strand:+ start:367 stop:1032 length:666 start_codon:yes stop_codon:yes gene_type:complete